MRYAILFSGMSFRRHVNGLEFCYRSLVDRLGFAPDNIQVLNYDGSLGAFGDPDGEPVGLWPGNGTPYRMPVDAEGTRTAFQHALRSLHGKLTPGDQLFINTTGHGGHHGYASGPDLITFPHCTRYRRDEFCADLATLPAHSSLVVLMAQCFSGGFNKAILEASTATSTFVASATSETSPSFMSFEDGQWDSFQRNWLAALAGQDVNGDPVATDSGRHGACSVHEAFIYASTGPRSNPYDSPEFAGSSSRSGEMTLHTDPMNRG